MHIGSVAAPCTAAADAADAAEQSTPPQQPQWRLPLPHQWLPPPPHQWRPPLQHHWRSVVWHRRQHSRHSSMLQYLGCRHRTCTRHRSSGPRTRSILRTRSTCSVPVPAATAARGIPAAPTVAMPHPPQYHPLPHPNQTQQYVSARVPMHASSSPSATTPAASNSSRLRSQRRRLANLTASEQRNTRRGALGQCLCARGMRAGDWHAAAVARCWRTTRATRGLSAVGHGGVGGAAASHSVSVRALCESWTGASSMQELPFGTGRKLRRVWCETERDATTR